MVKGRGVIGLAATAPPPPRESDQELMRRVGVGDAGAARQLVDRHLRPIIAFSYRLLGDAAEAEDVGQETFLRLWRSAARWEPKAEPVTWLHRVAYNLCVDRLRRRRNVPIEEAPETADPAPAAGTVIQLKEISAQVGQALQHLPQRQREAIVLVHFQDLSNIDAASIMGVSVEALESLLARGRRSLKHRLARLVPDLLGE